VTLVSMLAVTLAGSVTPAPAQQSAPIPGAVPPPPGAGVPPDVEAAEHAQAPDVTPARVSYVHGEVSFWRPGAEDWAPVRLNTPLAPGDRLYTGASGNVEIQIGPRAWVRAAEATQVGLDAHEPGYLQIRITEGYAAIDLRELPPGETVELATPQGALTVERAGYYRVDVEGGGRTTFTARRGGTATISPVGGPVIPLTANQRAVVTGEDAPAVQIVAAPAMEPWDTWNYQRSAALVAAPAPASVSASVYGAADLQHYGTWRTEETYGPVWVPAGVPAGWSPYSTGRWMWDPRFGWTWLDDAPWGWAPYHYGRWVHVRGAWGWAPGPVVVRPAYAPALVVFLGGPVAVGLRPVFWAPLAWGEPCIPWWGRAGFVGRPWWGGWGGPRVVNNVVVSRNTVVQVQNINVYRNVGVRNAVVGMSEGRFGRVPVGSARIASDDVRGLRPVRGPLDVRPVAASLSPAEGRGQRPGREVVERPVVATRPPRDLTPRLRADGLSAAPAAPSAATRLVTPPQGHGAARGASSDSRPAGVMPRDPGRAPGDLAEPSARPSAPRPSAPRPSNEQPLREGRDDRRRDESLSDRAPGRQSPRDATRLPVAPSPPRPPAPESPRLQAPSAVGPQEQSTPAARPRSPASSRPPREPAPRPEPRLQAPAVTAPPRPAPQQRPAPTPAPSVERAIPPRSDQRTRDERDVRPGQPERRQPDARAPRSAPTAPQISPPSGVRLPSAAPAPMAPPSDARPSRPAPASASPPSGVRLPRAAPVPVAPPSGAVRTAPRERAPAAREQRPQTRWMPAAQPAAGEVRMQQPSRPSAPAARPAERSPGGRDGNANRGGRN
jgi:hypothetical protein